MKIIINMCKNCRCIAIISILSVVLTLTVTPVSQGAEIDQAKWTELKRTVDLPNVQILKYVELGDPKGPPVVLLHGYTDNSRSWSLIVPYLESFRLFAIDQRGHGDSSKPDCCYTLTDMAYDVKLFLDALKIERATVVGHSLGSMVAQHFAANYPNRIAKLVLIGSTIKPATKRGDWLWGAIMELQAPIDPKGEFMKAWYANPNPVDAAFLEREMAESAAVPIHVWRGILKELLTNDFGRLAPDIKAETLIVWGDKDGFFNEQAQIDLRAALPTAQFKAFAGLGHNLMWENPAEVGEAIASFLIK
jgi:pimeloyl-ACP methyl ester carboxylesterase